MRVINLAKLSAILLCASAAALAQTPPPAAPATPEAPRAFSFSFGDGTYLGIATEEITKENMSRYGLSSVRGVGISRVIEGGPAEKAGLKKGDVIVQFDNEPVTSARKLLRLVGEAAPEQTVRLTVLRNGSEQQVTATLGQREDGSRALRALAPELRDFRVNPPAAPRVWGNGDNPETFFYSYGNNRRVGITTTPLTKQLADYFGVSAGKGLLVTSVSDNSPASKAGLRAGDVVTEVNGEKVEDIGDFVQAINRKEDGEVTVTIIRDKSQHTLRVTPERRTPVSLSQPYPFPTVSRIPPVRVAIPEINIPLALPQINIPVMPKMEILTLPELKNFKLQNRKLIELLQTPSIIL